MQLVHTVQMEGILPILGEGIKRGKDLPKKSKRYPLSNSNFIYLSAVNGISFPEIAATGISYALGSDKLYHFFLNIEWVKAHIDQFKERSMERESKGFREFMDELKIQKSIPGWHEDDVWQNQVISTGQIPLEGIEALLIRSWENDLNSEEDLWNIYGEDLNKINPKLIIKDGFENYIRLREFVPNNMKLYVGNEQQTYRIK